MAPQKKWNNVDGWWEKPQRILGGPKEPHWECGCGASGNWACALQCRKCKRDAPSGVQKKAKAASAAAIAKTSPSGTPRKPDKSSEIAVLRREIKELKAAAGKDPSATPPNDPTDDKRLEEIRNLEAAIAAMGHVLGAEETVLQLKGKLEGLRASRLAAKPASAQRKYAVEKVEKFQRSIQKAREQRELLVAKMEADRTTLAQTDEKLAGLRVDLAAAEVKATALVGSTAAPEVVAERFLALPVGLQQQPMWQERAAQFAAWQAEAGAAAADAQAALAQAQAQAEAVAPAGPSVEEAGKAEAAALKDKEAEAFEEQQMQMDVDALCAAPLGDDLDAKRKWAEGFVAHRRQKARAERPAPYLG